MKNMKRIHSVTIKHMFDESPDTSWLGEYSNSPTGEFSIDRNHFDACPCRWAFDSDEDDCDCNAGEWDTREFRYFNPGSVESFKADASWIPASENDKKAYWFKAMRENARKDYERMQALNSNDFCFIGISAEADYSVGGTPAPIQTITSGGLWGIESDSDASYFAEVEREELAELRKQLEGIGFSKRAIVAAFKNIDREND